MLGQGGVCSCRAAWREELEPRPTPGLLLHRRHCRAHRGDAGEDTLLDNEELKIVELLLGLTVHVVLLHDRVTCNPFADLLSIRSCLI